MILCIGFAFECIPVRGVRGAKDGCPLMCKRKFKENGMSSIPLEELTEEFGTTKVRTSVNYALLKDRHYGIICVV